MQKNYQPFNVAGGEYSLFRSPVWLQVLNVRDDRPYRSSTTPHFYGSSVAVGVGVKMKGGKGVSTSIHSAYDQPARTPLSETHMILYQSPYTPITLTGVPSGRVVNL